MHYFSFKSTNTLQQLTKPKLARNTQEQEKSGIYKLTCNTYQMIYIGQASRSLKQRYQEHIRYIRHNEPQSAYALHILSNKHEYSPINNTMTLLKHINKTSVLLPYEQLYIQSYHQHKQLISEQYVSEHNPMLSSLPK
jgi:phosphoribulokinase